MKLRQFYNVFKKSLDISRRARAAFEQGLHSCESCGHAVALDTLTPLSVVACPKCGVNNLVPYRLGDYLLFEPLGAGGVSSVYKAVHRSRENTFFAVKLLRDDREITETTLREFEFEAGVHHAVSPHPSIVRFIEAGTLGGDHFHAMEFVPGESVKRRVESSGRIPEILALTWLRELVGALRHILGKGYQYRDISPGNLLIRGDQSICLIDFGLALSIEDADQPGHPIVGTPEYLPPERIQQLGEDERSTVYSLGMLLIYMLKGEPLVKGGTHERAALQHVSAIRVAFTDRQLPPDISEKTVALCAWMIKYDPVDRPQTLEAVDKALAALLPA
ncbi:MAG TPA: serine/threonine-protein kinase [Kiritimatiellia bacterium]|nr:serine/threonine-protein kinase [Kiritimatiellia bacterium]HMP34514.1 serine/threonine-protein kinase [Kiritimatiellia bacterium]